MSLRREGLKVYPAIIKYLMPFSEQQLQALLKKWLEQETAQQTEIRQQQKVSFVHFGENKLQFYIYSRMNTGISKMYEGLFDTRAIYVSDYPSASDIELLKSLNITAVLTVAREFKINYPESVVPEHLSLPARDIEEYDIQAIFEETFQFIQKVHQTRNVLIHCGVGVSRSVAVFLAYLIRKHGYTFSTAHSIARKRRPIINPNKGFVRALEKYSEQYSSKETGSKEKDDLRMSRKSTQLALKRRLSLRDESKQCKPLNLHRQKSTLPSEIKSEIEDLEALNKVLEQKQKVQQKLQNLQAYYRDRSKREKTLLKLNSCSLTRKETTISGHSDLFQMFAKNSSSQI